MGDAAQYWRVHEQFQANLESIFMVLADHKVCILEEEFSSETT